MNKSDYLEKIIDIISNSTKFKFFGEIKQLDNIYIAESEIIKFLKQLLFMNETSEYLLNLIKPVGPATPGLYKLNSLSHLLV